MQYKNVKRGVFLERPNRFIARCLLDGREETVHVKNTGRCRELLRPGVPVCLAAAQNPARKTKYDLISVYKGDVLVNLDSQAPNAAVRTWLEAGGLLPRPVVVRPEVRFGSSRLDFYVENTDGGLYAEVKGVTLENNGIAQFPDAPTARGRRHLDELSAAVTRGFGAAVIFVVQMQGCRLFRPNEQTDPAFADTLRRAAASGVQVIALDAAVTKDSFTIHRRIAVQI